MRKFLSAIKTESSHLTQKSEEELQVQIRKVKERSAKEGLEKVMPEWFALVQEISFRKIGLKHFETQLLAGLLLYEGKIVEMKTGEGKTLASTLPASLNALGKKGVHIVTVNDYLAERDQKWMGKVYEGLGLKVGLVKSTSSTIEKRKSYFSDITYVTNSELVFDYLRDSSAYSLNEVVQKPFDYCIIDEIDSILIDEARTPLILSSFQGNVNKNKLYLSKSIATLLEKDFHFELDEKKREMNLTEAGYAEVTKKLGKKSLYDEEDPWILEILNALKAQYLFKSNKDYIVLNNKVLIVDEFTGRVMEDRRWSLGIHEAVEAKENVEIGGGTKTKSSITYQNFFTLYPKLAGMTGTGKTAEKEFQDIYNLEVIVVPTSKPMIRADLPDLVYQTEVAKWRAVIKKSKECFQKGQPILIGTASVEKSEFLSELFRISEIPHQVLNAKPENIRRESEIVAQAGKRSAVTIATNMAGRGTDIILGGNPIFQIKQKFQEIFLEKRESNDCIEIEDDFSKLYIQKIIEEYQDFNVLEADILNLPYSLETSLPSFQTFYTHLSQILSEIWKQENTSLKLIGGLFVLGTERHETRRIDNQLRGRAGRQGDPGSSQFYVSLDDELIKIFGGESIGRWVEYLLQDKDIPLESTFLTKSLEKAQQKVESYNYDLRKNVFQYDDILNIQRKLLFRIRKEILEENFSSDLFLRSTESFFDEELSWNSPKRKEKKYKNRFGKTHRSRVDKWFGCYSTFEKKKQKKFLFFKRKNQNNPMKKTNEFSKEIWISNDLEFAQSNFYQRNFLKNTRTNTLLQIIDSFWTEHLERMSYIRETIGWRSYGQQDPLVEYNMEAFESFKKMFDQIRSAMIYYFLKKEFFDSNT